MIKQLLIGLGTIITLDFLWLGVIMKNFYKNQLGNLYGGITGPANLIVGITVWIAIVLGIIFFVLPTTFWNAPLRGALFGFLVYLIYDGTNYALVKGWPLSVTAVDILWGTALCATVTYTLSIIST